MEGERQGRHFCKSLAPKSEVGRRPAYPGRSSRKFRFEAKLFQIRSFASNLFSFISESIHLIIPLFDKCYILLLIFMVPIQLSLF